ncbi:MAG: Ig-like domain-containing protein [Dysgonomonas sp.]
MNKKYHTPVYPNQSLKVEKYFFTYHKRTNLYLLLLLLFVTISVSHTHAEGSGNWKGTQTSRQSSLWVPGNSAGNSGYDTRGSMMRPSATSNYDPNHRFYVYVKAGETVYFSFRSSTSSNLTWYYDNTVAGYNTLFPSGLSASGQTAVTTTNSNLQGRISTNTSLTQAQAVAGPSALTSGGYATSGTASTSSSNQGGQFTNNTGQNRAFWVEITSPGTNGFEISEWDVTVGSGTTKNPGRVYCKYWSIYNGLPGTSGQTSSSSFHDNFGFYVPVDNTYSAQTDDYYIKYVNFGKSNAGYVVFFANDSGPLNNLVNGVPDIQGNRKSIKGTSNRYQYPLFVADPDESIWKTSLGPKASTDVRFGRKADATGGEAYFIVYVDTPGILDILVDIDGSGSYSAGDVRIFRNFSTAGTYDVYWDGKDENGNVVPAGTNIKLYTSANFFPVHFPVYDMEQSLGITMRNVRPIDLNKATVKLYWDHSNIYTGVPGKRNTNWFTVPANLSGTFEDTNVQSPAVNTTGVDSPADIWWANGNYGIGNENTFNVYAGSWMETMELNFTFNWDKSDIEVLKTVNNPTPAIGSEVTFTIKATNNGMMYAQKVTVNDLLPSGYQYISHTAPMGSTVTPAPIGSNDPATWSNQQTTYNPLTGEWTIYDIPYDVLDLSKNERVLTIRAKVLKSGVYNNTAEGYPEVISSDLNHANNTSTVIVNPTNTTNAVNDINVTPENKSISGNVLTNDFDLEGHIQTVTSTGSFTTVNGGTVQMNADGTYTYTPPGNFTGTDSFTYTVCDDVPLPLKACATATVTINVIPERDPSVNNNVVANNDAGITEQDIPVSGNVLTNDFDPDGDNLVINTTPVTPPAQGSVTISADGTYVYTPAPGFKGVDTFVYEVCDDGNPVTCDRATVTITVLPKSDKTNHTYANDDVFYSEVNKPVNGNVLVNDFDPEGDDQTVNTTPVKAPIHGSVTLNADGTFIYTPSNGFTGTDSFVYEACDNGIPVACDRATVYIQVNPEPISANLTYAIDDINITYKNTLVSGNVLTNDFDPEGNTQTVTSHGTITTAKGGTVVLNTDGSYLYTPKNDFIGEDSFTYTVCDNGVPQACDQATVTINVIERPVPTINNNIIANDDEAFTRTNIPVSGNVLTNDFDPDGDNMIINTTPVTSPAHGSVTISADGTYTYTPDPGFTGRDSFIYEVCDDGNPVTCDRATVTIIIRSPQVGNANDTYAYDDMFYIDGKQTLNGNVLVNDFDPEGNQQILKYYGTSSAG